MSKLPPELFQVAIAQNGLFTTQQALSHGTGEVALARHTAQRTLVHPMRGLYCLAEHASEDPVEWHQQLCRAAVLLYDDAALTNVSSVIAHDIPVWGCDLTRPFIRRAVNRGRGARGVIVRRPMSGREPTPLGPAVPLSTALLEVPMDFGLVAGVVSLDAALHRGKVTIDVLEAQLEVMANWPKSAWARAALQCLNPLSESVAESIAGAHLTLQNIEVSAQFVVRDDRDRFAGRADYRVDGTNLLLEVDGKMKYADDGKRTPQDIVFAEKRREDDMRACGWRFSRLYWSDVVNQRRMIAKVQAAIGSSA